MKFISSLLLGAAAVASAQDIVDVASNGSFTTLVTALTAAGLVDALKGDGPFTVFAPTDEAFAKLPNGTVAALLNDIDALTSILLYHVLSGEVRAERLVTLDWAKTLNGADVTIVAEGGTVKINDATVVVVDVVASNGVVHAIDTVLIPPTKTKRVKSGKRGERNTRNKSSKSSKSSKSGKRSKSDK